MTPELRALAAKLIQDLGYARLTRLWRQSIILPQEVWILSGGPGGSLSDQTVNDRSVGQRHQPRDGPASIGDLDWTACLNPADHRTRVDPELADPHPMHGLHDDLHCISLMARAFAAARQVDAGWEEYDCPGSNHRPSSQALRQ